MKKLILSCLYIILFSGTPLAGTKFVTDKIKAPLRTGPSTKHDIVTVIESGQELEILESDSYWSKIRLQDGKVGWTLSRLIEKYPEELCIYEHCSNYLKNGFLTDKIQLTLRKGPSNGYKIITIMTNGQELVILKSESDWSKVRLQDGKEGWALSRYLINYPINRWCVEGNCSNGYGKYIYSNKSEYLGNFKNNLRHGQGTMSWQNGFKYIGEFHEGKKHGDGRILAPDGTIEFVEFDHDILKNKIATIKPQNNLEMNAEAQRELLALGYDAGSADGIIGQKTLEAIILFQSQSGLPVDGKVTPELIEQLRKTRKNRSSSGISFKNSRIIGK